MKTVYAVALIALLVLNVTSFKIRQGGNGYATSVQDATAGVQEIGQAWNDAIAAGTDAFGAATQNFQNMVGGMAGAFGGAQAAATRLQQGGNGFQQVMNDIQSVWGDVGQATEDFLNSGEDAFDATIQQTNQLVDNVANAGAPTAATRLQQGGNGFQQSLVDLQQVWADLGDATEDFLNSGEDVVDATVQQTDQLVDNVANAGAPAATRLQQGGNGFQQSIADLQRVWGDLGDATEDFLNSGEDAFDATVQGTDQLVDNVANAGAPATRLQQGGSGFQQSLADLQQVWMHLGEATEAFLNSGEDAVDATVQQADQLVDNVANAGAPATRLQQGGNGFQQTIADLQRVWGELGQATEDFLNSGEDVVDATVQQTDQLVDNVANAGAPAAGTR